MIAINQGDTQTLRIELFTETGEPWTPTDEIILFCICTKTGILLSKRAPAQGEVFLNHTDTDIPAGTYRIEVRVFLPDLTYVGTPIKDTLQIMEMKSNGVLSDPAWGT